MPSCLETLAERKRNIIDPRLLMDNTPNISAHTRANSSMDETNASAWLRARVQALSGVPWEHNRSNRRGARCFDPDGEVTGLSKLAKPPR